MGAALEFLIPTPPRGIQRVKVPDSMTDEEKARLMAELGEISRGLARIDAREEERRRFLESRFAAIESRLAKLETVADETGAHRIASIQAKLVEERAIAARERAHVDKTRDRIWSIVAVLLTSAIVGLVTHYLSTR